MRVEIIETDGTKHINNFKYIVIREMTIFMSDSDIECKSNYEYFDLYHITRIEIEDEEEAAAK